jgi:hypothetical protein
MNTNTSPTPLTDALFTGDMDAETYSHMVTLARKLETDLAGALTDLVERNGELERSQADRAALIADLTRLVNLSGHPLFVPQSDLPAWDERIEEARATLARMQS